MPIINMCDKGALKLTPEQLERLNSPDIRRKLAQRHEQAEAWIRKVRISHKKAIRECAGMPIGKGHTRN